LVYWAGKRLELLLEKAEEFFLGFLYAIADEKGELFDISMVGFADACDVFGPTDGGDNGNRVVFLEQ